MPPESKADLCLNVTTSLPAVFRSVLSLKRPGRVFTETLVVGSRSKIACPPRHGVHSTPPQGAPIVHTLSRVRLVIMKYSFIIYGNMRPASVPLIYCTSEPRENEIDKSPLRRFGNLLLTDTFFFSTLLANKRRVANSRGLTRYYSQGTPETTLLMIVIVGASRILNYSNEIEIKSRHLQPPISKVEIMQVPPTKRAEN